MVVLVCLTGTLYGNVDFVDERHRHRYEVCELVIFVWFYCYFYCCWLIVSFCFIKICEKGMLNNCLLYSVIIFAVQISHPSLESVR